MNANFPRVPQDGPGASSPVFANYQYSHVHWATPGAAGSGQENNTGTTSTAATPGTENGALLQENLTTSPTTSTNPASFGQQQPIQVQQLQPQTSSSSQQPAHPGPSSNSPAPGTLTNYSLPSGSSISTLDTTGLISLTGSNPPVLPTGSAPPTRPPGADEDGEGDDEFLPAMADDDYSAQLSWQSQSKDNLKYVCGPHPPLIVLIVLLTSFPCYSRVLMENFSPAQYDRFEAYRRHALPKQAVRKVCWLNNPLSRFRENSRLIPVFFFRSFNKRSANRFRSLLLKSLPVLRKFSWVRSLRRVCLQLHHTLVVLTLLFRYFSPYCASTTERNGPAFARSSTRGIQIIPRGNRPCRSSSAREIKETFCSVVSHASTNFTTFPPVSAPSEWFYF
jgi:hypothetical protein